MDNLKRAKQLRFMQWMVTLSTLLCAAVMYFTFSNIEIAPVVSAVLVILAVGEFFFFGDQAAKFERAAKSE